MNVHYQSPASRFHHLSNYLTLAINGVFLEDMVLRSISEGRKPVIAVANTGDALLRDLISQQIEETLTTNLVAFLAIQYIKEQTAKYSKNATFILKSYYYQKITKLSPKLKSIEKSA